MDEWIRSHVEDVPANTLAFCGDIFAGKTMLDVGCGEMLSCFGLLDSGVRSIVGLDVSEKPADFLDRIAGRIRENGHHVANDYKNRLSYTTYNGTEFPFSNGVFDIVFSWSAFEHIDDVRAVLREMHRVLHPEGTAFVQVDPWFPSRNGSHLAEWVEQPFFHLVQRDAWVWVQLQEFVTANPGADRDFITKYMFNEYRALNRISSCDFYSAVRDSGFIVKKARIMTHDEDLSDAPVGVTFSDLMIRGTMMVLKKGGVFASLDRIQQL